MSGLDKVHCAHCGVEHDLRDIEPSYARPDLWYAVPPQERQYRVWEGKDEFGIRSLDDSERRYYLRVGLPFPVHGGADVCQWGVWVEVKDRAFYRTRELWDNEAQEREPPFPGRLANDLKGYDGSLNLPGSVQLTGPQTIPVFHLANDLDHPLAIEQREGVLPERVLEWVWGHLHPEPGNSNA